MSKPPKINLAEVLIDEPFDTDAIEIDSMVNQAYLENLPIIRIKIEENQRKNSEAYNRIKDLFVYS